MAKYRPNNPFLIEGYIDDKYFCDRVEETETMIKAFESSRNITLMSPRRMGKSGLIHHVFDHLRHTDGVACYYIDIFHTQNLRDFINVFANAVFGSLDSPIDKLFSSVTKIFQHCRPTITPDPYSGMPVLSLQIDNGQENTTLGDIFKYLNSSSKRKYIAFDEFQQVAEYPEQGVEALLRSYIQFAHNISFVFAGSKKHLMQEMFLNPSRPFYQSTQTLSLKPIDREVYYLFCSDFFTKAGKRLDRDAFDSVYDSVMGHTWYVQYWMSRIYESAPSIVDKKCAEMTLGRILREEDDNFYAYTQLMTSAQLRAAKGIARMGILEAPFSSEDFAKYDMGTPSTVRSCIKTLTDREVLLQDRNQYSLYNRFFMLWLKAISSR